MLYKVHTPFKVFNGCGFKCKPLSSKNFLWCCFNYAVQGGSKLILNLSLNDTPFSQAAIYKLKKIFQWSFIFVHSFAK